MTSAPPEPEPAAPSVEDAPVSTVKREKVPISPALVKPPLRFEGVLLSELTGYDGWLYTDEDLNNIAELVEKCGLEASPAMQLILAVLGIHGAKAAGYLTWVQRGRGGTSSETERPEATS